MLDQDAGLWVGPDEGPDAYRLVSLLGRGGEGAVWKAELPLSPMGRGRVAVKIQADTGDEVSAAAWTRYGRLLASVHHPGVVRVREVFVGPPRHPHGQTLRMTSDGPGAVAVGERARYVVMDFVDGRPLTQWIEENPSAGISHRLRLLATIADALDELHSGRQTAVPMAHGDVKPGNMIVTGDDTAVLVDLGGTRLTDGPGEWLLTAAYAAPELYRPDGSGTTPEADRFAFVASVVHLLVDVPPVLNAEGRLDPDGVAAQLRDHPRTSDEALMCAELLAALRAAPSDRPAPLSAFLTRLLGTAARQTSAVTLRSGPVTLPASATRSVPPDVASPVDARRRARAVRRAGAIGAAALLAAIGAVVLLPLRDGSSTNLAAPSGPTPSVVQPSTSRPSSVRPSSPSPSSPSLSSRPASAQQSSGTPASVRPASPPQASGAAASARTPSTQTSQLPAASPDRSPGRNAVPVTVTVTTTTAGSVPSQAPPTPTTRTAQVNSCNTYGQYCTAKNIYVSVPPDGYNYRTFPKITTAAHGTTLTARCWAEGGRTYNWAAKIATPDPGPAPYDSTIYYSVQAPGTSRWGFIPDTYFARDKDGRLGLSRC